MAVAGKEKAKQCGGGEQVVYQSTSTIRRNGTWTPSTEALRRAMLYRSATKGRLSKKLPLRSVRDSTNFRVPNALLPRFWNGIFRNLTAARLPLPVMDSAPRWYGVLTDNSI